MRVKMDDGGIVKIDGEMVVGGFVAEKKSIVKWEEPAHVPIDDITREYIVAKVLEESNKVLYDYNN